MTIKMELTEFKERAELLFTAAVSHSKLNGNQLHIEAEENAYLKALSPEDMFRHASGYFLHQTSSRHSVMQIPTTCELITDEWLLEADFKWRQDERQPNRHYTLKINQISTDNMIEQSGVELQRCGWNNDNGKYIGDIDNWMIWVTDRFDSRIFLTHISEKEQLVKLIEIISGYGWNTNNHIYGQTWPDGKKPL